MTDKKTALVERICDALKISTFHDSLQLVDGLRAWEAEKDAEIAAKDARIADLESASTDMTTKEFDAAARIAELESALAAKDARIEELAKANQQLFDIGKRQFDKLESAQLAQDPEIDRYLQDAFQKGMEYANLLAAHGAGEPVALQHMAYAEDGELQWCTGRKIKNCELYAMPDFGNAPQLYAGRPPAPEQARPDIIEKLTYHQHERDDMTLDDCLSFLSTGGWHKVRGRTEREMVLQIAALLAGQPAEQAEAVRKDGVVTDPREIVFFSAARLVDALYNRTDGFTMPTEAARELEMIKRVIDAALAAGGQG